MGAEGTGLIVGPGSTVSLKNGAQACNVFWVLDTATIDTTAVLKGNVLALNSITVANGANIEGRLLARNGNVTLINDTISIANCAAVTTSVSTPTVLGTSTSTVVPKLPNAGIAPETQSNAPNSAILATAITVTFLPYFIRRKKSV